MYQRYVKGHPADAAMQSNMGLALGAEGRDEEALTAYKQALAADDSLRSAHVNIANYYRYHEDPAGAIRHLQRAIELSPSDFYAHGGLGAVYSDEKHWNRALAEYNAVLELNPGNVHGETEMAIAMMQLGQLDDAKQHLQAVVSRNPDWVRAHDGLARVYRIQGQMKEAEKEAHLALIMQPDDAMSHDVLGKIYMAEGHTAQAADQYTAAIKSDPADKLATKYLSDHSRLPPASALAKSSSARGRTTVGGGKRTIRGGRKAVQETDGQGGLDFESVALLVCASVVTGAVLYMVFFRDKHGKTSQLLSTEFANFSGEDEHLFLLQGDPQRTETAR